MSADKPPITQEQYQSFIAKVEQSPHYQANEDFRAVVDLYKVVILDEQSPLESIDEAISAMREAMHATLNPEETDKFEDKTASEFYEFIGGLALTSKSKEKLRKLIAGYNEACMTAKELDPCVQVPSGKRVIARIMALGAEKLIKIAKIMGKPGYVIVPDKSFLEIKDAMNANRHYENQKEAFFAKDYNWSDRTGKISVCIMDMAQNAAVVPGQKPGKQQNDVQLRICEKYFRDNGMRLVSDRQYAVGMQQSLWAYERAKKQGEANPGRHILDFWQHPQETVTMFNQEHDSFVQMIARGDFTMNDMGVNFNWSSAHHQLDNLRGRGVVEIMESTSDVEKS